MFRGRRVPKLVDSRFVRCVAIRTLFATASVKLVRAARALDACSEWLRLAAPKWISASMRRLTRFYLVHHGCVSRIPHDYGQWRPFMGLSKRT